MQRFICSDCQSENRRMKRIYFIIGLLILLFSCRKSNSLSDPECNNPFGNISGKWALSAKRSYSIPGNDTSWLSVDKGDRVIIEFAKDSVFSYNVNYIWKMENYDRFTKTDSLDFRIYSSNPPASGNFPHFPSVFVKMITVNEIELIYMGVDAGEDEKYIYSCSN